MASQAEKLIEKFQNVRSREEIADGLKNIDREIEEKENQLEKAENDKNKKIREKDKEQEEQIVKNYTIFLFYKKSLQFLQKAIETI